MSDTQLLLLVMSLSQCVVPTGVASPANRLGRLLPLMRALLSGRLWELSHNQGNPSHCPLHNCGHNSWHTRGPCVQRCDVGDCLQETCFCPCLD